MGDIGAGNMSQMMMDEYGKRNRVFLRFYTNEMGKERKSCNVTMITEKSHSR